MPSLQIPQHFCSLSHLMMICNFSTDAYGKFLNQTVTLRNILALASISGHLKATKQAVVKLNECFSAFQVECPEICNLFGPHSGVAALDINFGGRGQDTKVCEVPKFRIQCMFLIVYACMHAHLYGRMRK